MIAILFEDEYQEQARIIEAELQRSYENNLHIALLPAETTTGWPTEQAWDDMLIVLFGDVPLGANAVSLLESLLGFQGSRRVILPVAMSPTSKPSPPAPINHLKALRWNGDTGNTAGQLPRRVGALLGLRIRNRDQKIFVSYRSVDGTALAIQIETFLAANGFHVWRDEARDAYDDEANIQAANDVQAVIEENLVGADMLLLLDTPMAAQSRWIKLEVDLANGQLIPVLPLLFLQTGERNHVSRFRALLSLQRGCEFAPVACTAQRVLTDDELHHLLGEVESFLSEIFQRKLRIPFLVQKEFDSRGYHWSTRDRFIYEALRKNMGLMRTRVFSHCSYFEGVYDPALLAYIQHYTQADPRANYALYIYDGPVIPPTQMEEIIHAARLQDSSDFIILNYQEVGTLLHTNFTSRTL